MKTKTVLLIVVIVVLAAIIGGYFLTKDNAAPGELDSFAQCLTDRGAIFYGTFWCKYCQAQKRAFGKSVPLLPYIECSTPDGRDQTDECRSKGIESYPTWEFADESRETGVLPLEKLAEKTGCLLPE